MFDPDLEYPVEVSIVAIKPSKLKINRYLDGEGYKDIDLPVERVYFNVCIGPSYNKESIAVKMWNLIVEPMFDEEGSVIRGEDGRPMTRVVDKSTCNLVGCHESLSLVQNSVLDVDPNKEGLYVDWDFISNGVKKGELVTRCMEAFLI